MSDGVFSKFARLEKIGEGVSGVVYKCISRKSKQLKAMKQVDLENYDYWIPSRVIREIASLRELRHPNIVTLEQVIRSHDYLYLIFEYLPVSLERHLRLNCKRSGLPPDTVKSFVYQMLQALKYCHVKRIIHRDLKPANILVDTSRNVVKLADFGLSRHFDYTLRALTHEVVTLRYRPPELLLGETVYCYGVDMWSMGCIFAEIATGVTLFRGNCEIDQLFRIFRMKGVPTEESWPGVTKLRNFNPQYFPSWHTNRLCSEERIVRALGAEGLDLLTALLLYDPSSRIDAQQALVHPYFADLDRELMSAVREEYVGQPVEMFPPSFAERFDDMVRLIESNRDDGAVDEKWAEEEMEVFGKMPKIALSLVLAGASVCQMVASREKFAKEESDEKEEMEQ